MAVCVLRLYFAVPGLSARCGRVCSGLGFGCAPPLPGEVWQCVCVCVLFPRGPLHLLAGDAVRKCVLGPGLLPRPATPGWGVGACVCLCGRPACTPPFLAWVRGVGVRAGLGFWLCSASLGWVVGVCVCLCRCPACTPSFLGGRLRRGDVRVLSWVGFAPPPVPFGVCSFFWWGGAVACSGVALWCRSLAVAVLGLVVSVALPLSFGPRLRVILLIFLLPQRGVCRRVRGVPSSDGPLLRVWCCRFLVGWSSGAPSGGPVLGAVWLGGLDAFCGVRGRFPGCGPFPCPSPPAFFLGGGGCLFLPLRKVYSVFSTVFCLSCCLLLV